jgi:seryl-tRNA synthetase
MRKVYVLSLFKTNLNSRLKMSLLENKQLTHVISEVVALVGLTFYFSSQNKKLSNHIEEIAQRLEEQEDQIQKLEGMLRQLAMNVNMTNQRLEGVFNVKHAPIPVIPKLVEKSVPKIQIKEENNTVKEFSENTEEEAEEDDLSDSDLDEEIKQEIEELEAVNSLKKDH